MAVIKGKSYTVLFYAWNRSDGTPKTGDAANITVRISKDGGPMSATSGSPAELDSTYAPGWYRITLTDSEMNADSILVVPRSATSGVACQQMLILTDKAYVPGIKNQTDKLAFNDQYFVLAEIRSHDAGWQAPIAMSQPLPATPLAGTVGEALKFADTRLDATVSSRATPADIMNTPVSLAGAEHDGIVVDVQFALNVQGYTAQRAAKLDNLNATVSSRAAPGDAMTLTSSERSSIASAVWSATTRTLTSFGSLVSEVAAAVWGFALEGAWTAARFIRLFGAVLLGKVSGAQSNQPVFRDVNDTKNRVTMQVDNDGNRTSVTLDGD